MTKKVLKIVLSVALAAVLLYFAFRGIDWKSFLDGLLQTDWRMMLCYTAVAVLALVFREIRWRRMLLPFDKGVKRLDVWDAVNVGNVVNIVLPGAGEFVRCGKVSKGQIRYDKALGSIVSERAFDFLAVGLLFIAALVLKRDRFGAFFKESILEPAAGRMGMWTWVILGAGFAAVGLLLWAVIKFKDSNRLCAKIHAGVVGLWEGFTSVFRAKGGAAFSISTIGIWTMYVLMSYFTLRAIPSLEGLNFIDALFISAVGNVASVIPVPGGIGAYHYLVALTLQSIYGITWETGILFATLSHEAHAIIILLLGTLSASRSLTK